MKAQIVIPKGWRRLPAGTLQQERDRRLSMNLFWVEIDPYEIGDRVTAGEYVIRRTKRRKLAPWRYLSESEKLIRRCASGMKSIREIEVKTMTGDWSPHCFGHVATSTYRTRLSVKALAKLQGVPVP